MVKKQTDKVPTVGTKNLNKQKIQEVETAAELTPTGKGKLKDSKEKSFTAPKPGEGG